MILIETTCPGPHYLIDVGENPALVMLSVTKGEDKPLKYPTIFNSVDAAVITKAESCGSR